MLIFVALHSHSQVSSWHNSCLWIHSEMQEQAQERNFSYIIKLIEHNKCVNPCWKIAQQQTLNILALNSITLSCLWNSAIWWKLCSQVMNECVPSERECLCGLGEVQTKYKKIFFHSSCFIKFYAITISCTKKKYKE